MADFAKNPPEKWSEIKWTFLKNPAYVKIEINGKSHKHHFSELGFKDSKKGDGFNNLWDTLLYGFAEHDEIYWATEIDRDIKSRLKSDISRLRKNLKFHFGLDEDPFHEYKKKNAYKLKFVVSIEDRLFY